MVEHDVGPPRRLQRLAEDGIVETGIGIIRKVGIGVTLDDRQPARERRRDVTGIKLDTARIAPLGAQFGHQSPVAAPDIEHAGTRRHMARDDRKVSSQHVAHKKPDTTRSSSGTSRKNASCP